MKKDTHTINIKIKNVTEAQAIAIESLLYMWGYLGGLGSSRWTSFFADGDGNFHPNIEINGKKPQHTEFIEKDDLWLGCEYRMDYDTIAWKLRDLDEKKKNKMVSYIKSSIIINKIKYKFCPWVRKLWEKST
jgi:hypothetical protein